jgi:hypothetical protein
LVARAALHQKLGKVSVCQARNALLCRLLRMLGCRAFIL